jgi:uncharacterized 2Fe-2S/4Fe-4S cluster protein (DUF4445 family)
VDLSALLLAQGVLSASGRLALQARELRLAPNGLAFSQRDVREIQKAKAAVEVGVRAVLAEASIAADDLRYVVLSGAFAKGLHLGHAQAIGLIPVLAAERFLIAGNTALLGAGFCLDRSLVRCIRQSGRKVILHTEGFATRFAEAVQLRPWQ